MNYLAHAWLSFHHPEILVGNMMSDFVKGKKKFEYSEGIQKGITLHRLIDTFTDAHAVTKNAKKVFKPAAGLYSGAFLDIVYDHFLAIDESQLSESEWKWFSQEVYECLHQYKNVLPDRFSNLLPYMSQQNWLFNYRYIWGIENSFGGLVRRAAYLQSSTAAFKIFEKEYHQLKVCYSDFFPSVETYAFQQFQMLTINP